jgi:hypothetical protein
MTRFSWRLVGASTLLLSTLLLLCAACSGSHPLRAADAPPAAARRGNASASCAAPYLDDRPSGRLRSTAHGPVPTVSPGGTITVYGHWYTSTCNDTGGHDPMEPLPPVPLTLDLPGGKVAQLGEFEPGGADMGFKVEVHVPPGTPAGAAHVRDDQRYPSTFEFEVDR